MSKKGPPALDQLDYYADESIGATYGTLSAALVAQLVSVARDEHAAEIRRAKAEAWDEGFVVGEVYETREYESPASYAPKDAGNPYREAAP